MSHKLGIMQFQQKLPRHKRLEIMRENILSGKKREAEIAEEVRISIQKQLEEKESKIISNLAESIAKRKGISLIEAMSEAQKEFYKGKQ